MNNELNEESYFNFDASSIHAKKSIALGEKQKRVRNLAPRFWVLLWLNLGDEATPAEKNDKLTVQQHLELACWAVASSVTLSGVSILTSTGNLLLCEGDDAASCRCFARNWKKSAATRRPPLLPDHCPLPALPAS